MRDEENIPYQVYVQVLVEVEDELFCVAVVVCSLQVLQQFLDWLCVSKEYEW